MVKEFEKLLKDFIEEYPVNEVLEGNYSGDEFLEKLESFKADWDEIDAKIIEKLSSQWNVEASKLSIFSKRGIKFYQMVFVTKAELFSTGDEENESLVDGLRRDGLVLVPEVLTEKVKPEDDLVKPEDDVVSV